jgi:predicted dehydrogenase
LESKKNLGVAIIGIQGYGRTYPYTLLKIPGVAIAAVCDVNTDAATAFAEKYNVPVVTPDYREILKMPQVDAVLIATPHFLHYPMVMDSLRAKKHVFCEKPLAITSKDAWEMAATARTEGRVLSCHYNRRRMPESIVLRALMLQGVFGTVYHVNVKWVSRYTDFMFDSRTSWRVSKEKAGGGILIGRGSHMLDATWYILGKPEVESVYSVINSRLTGLDVDDYATVLIKLKNGTSIHLECTYEANSAAYNSKIEYEVFGTKAGAIYSACDGNRLYKVGYNAFPENRWVDLTDTIDVSSFENSESNSVVEDFIQSVLLGREPLVTAEDAAFITQLIEAAYQSARSGQSVSI